MTSPTSLDPAAAGAPGESEIVAFLRANPHFLDQHPELLRDLSIQHPSGDAVSLLERQVAVLREENARVRQQLDELVARARENEALNRRIHDLALKLVNAVGPQAIFASLDRCLKADFGADRITSFVFAEPSFVDSGDVAAFVGPRSPVRGAFAGVIEAGRTVCGPLPAEQRAALFSSEDADGSAVVMPLNGKGWDGVLVIGSEDAGRYEADMGTDLLTYLSDVVTLVLDPWVKRPRTD